MRVVGYVREGPAAHEGEPAFSQTEKIRRWMAQSGHQLVAVCQDVPTPGRALGREGYRALLGIIASGEVDGVILPELSILATDKILQEIMLWDLRNRGVSVMSTIADDLVALEVPSSDQTRTFLRDVLAKLTSYEELAGLTGTAEIQPPPTVLSVGEASEVIVKLLPSEPGLSEQTGQS